jgi:hypothetical protein
MEVHHHVDAGHKKKKFREYFLEFIMIFLAVSLGFLAENVRERIGDRRKENDYLESLMQDLKTDTAKMENTVAAVYKQMRGLDTLEMLLTPDLNRHDSAILVCYLHAGDLVNENTMNFSDRTISQLFSSGSMRLFKKQSISDSITDYYSTIRTVDAQKQYYKDYFQKCLVIAQELYEFDALHTRVDSSGKLIEYEPTHGKFHISVTSADELKKIKITIEIYKRIIGSYRNDIKDLNKKAKALLRFLKEEYGIRENKPLVVAR